MLPIILVDEYDTPLLEAYTQGYWDEMIAACRQIFHNAFKQNDFYSRAAPDAARFVDFKPAGGAKRAGWACTFLSRRFAGAFPCNGALRHDRGTCRERSAAAGVFSRTRTV